MDNTYLLRNIISHLMKTHGPENGTFAGVIIYHLQRNEKIAAIKLLREVTGFGLKESKDFIESCFFDQFLPKPGYYKDKKQGTVFFVSSPSKGEGVVVKLPDLQEGSLGAILGHAIYAVGTTHKLDFKNLVKVKAFFRAKDGESLGDVLGHVVREASD